MLLLLTGNGYIGFLGQHIICIFLKLLTFILYHSCSNLSCDQIPQCQTISEQVELCDTSVEILTPVIIPQSVPDPPSMYVKFENTK